MEDGLTMLGHSIFIGIIVYIAMVMMLKQSKDEALDRSVLIGSLVCAYMVTYGHGLPSSSTFNPNIYKSY
jgi:hypothetical protein